MSGEARVCKEIVRVSSYAVRECDSCYVQLPANAMHAHTRNRETGSSHSRTSGSSNTRTTTHYRREDYFLCPPCHDARRRAQLILIVATVIGLIVIYIVGAVQQPSSPRPTTQTTTTPKPTNLLDGVDLQSVDTMSPDPNETSAPVAEAEPLGDPVVERAPPEPQAALEASTGGGLDGLEDDIQTALSSGNVRAWQSESGAGYVVPSSLQQGLAAQCRTYIVTAIEGQSQSQLEVGERCLDEGSGRWVAR